MRKQYSEIVERISTRATVFRTSVNEYSSLYLFMMNHCFISLEYYKSLLKISQTPFLPSQGDHHITTFTTIENPSAPGKPNYNVFHRIPYRSQLGVPLKQPPPVSRARHPACIYGPHQHESWVQFSLLRMQYCYVWQCVLLKLWPLLLFGL